MQPLSETPFVHSEQNIKTPISLLKLQQHLQALRKQFPIKSGFLYVVAQELMLYFQDLVHIRDLHITVIELIIKHCSEEDAQKLLLSEMSTYSTLLDIILSTDSINSRFEIITILFNNYEKNISNTLLFQLLKSEDTTPAISLHIFAKLLQICEPLELIQRLQEEVDEEYMLISAFLLNFKRRSCSRFFKLLFPYTANIPLESLWKKQYKGNLPLNYYFSRMQTSNESVMSFIATSYQHFEPKSLLGLLQASDNNGPLLKILFLKQKKSDCLHLLQQLFIGFELHKKEFISILINTQILTTTIAISECFFENEVELLELLMQHVDEDECLQIFTQQDTVQISFLHYLIYRTQNEKSIIHLIKLLFSFFDTKKEQFISLLFDKNHPPCSYIGLLLDNKYVPPEICDMILKTCSNILSTDIFFQLSGQHNLQQSPILTVFENILMKTRKCTSHSPSNCITLLTLLCTKRELALDFLLTQNKNQITLLHFLFKKKIIHNTLCLPLIRLFITYFRPEDTVQLLISTDSQNRTLLMTILRTACKQDSLIILQTIFHHFDHEKDLFCDLLAQKDINDNTLLHTLVHKQYNLAAIQLIQLLPSDELSNVNAEGLTPLVLAYSYGMYDVYQKILEKTSHLERDLQQFTSFAVPPHHALNILIKCPKNSLQISHLSWALSKKTLITFTPDNTPTQRAILPLVLERLDIASISTQDILSLPYAKQQNKLYRELLEWWVKNNKRHHLNPISELLKKALFHRCSQEVIQKIQKFLPTEYTIQAPHSEIDENFLTSNTDQIHEVLKHTPYRSIPEKYIDTAIHQHVDKGIVHKMIAKTENVRVTTLQTAIDNSYDPEVLCDLIDKLNVDEAQDITITMNDTYLELVQEKILENFTNRVYRNIPSDRWLRVELIYPKFFSLNRKNEN